MLNKFFAYLRRNLYLPEHPPDDITQRLLDEKERFEQLINNMQDQKEMDAEMIASLTKRIQTLLIDNEGWRRAADDRTHQYYYWMNVARQAQGLSDQDVLQHSKKEQQGR